MIYFNILYNLTIDNIKTIIKYILTLSIYYLLYFNSKTYIPQILITLNYIIYKLKLNPIISISFIIFIQKYCLKFIKMSATSINNDN